MILTKTEQAQLVRGICQLIEQDTLQDVLSGRVPEDWTGFELRELLADRFKSMAGKMSRTRKREYNNTIMIRNL